MATTEVPAGTVVYGILEPKDWDELSPIFAEHGTEVPDSDISTAAIARDSETGELLGLLMLQLQYHAEPLWISKEGRGRVNFLGLVEALNGLFTANGKTALYYTFATNETQEKMCRLNGMKEMPWKIFRKEG